MTKPLDPSAIAVDKMAELLTRLAGVEVTAAMIEADIAEGAPVNDDGSIHLVNFAAWLLARGAKRGGH